MSTNANPNPNRKRRWRGPPRQGPVPPQPATVGAMFAHEQGADGAQKHAPSFPRVVATTGERGTDGVKGSASNAGRGGDEAEGVDGSYLTETR
jgi:hypothetical protein